MTKTILLVDNEKSNREVVRHNLEKQGYVVLTAETGNEALSEAQKLPDLIVLDILIPGLDGLEVTRRLKQDRKTDQIPFLFTSANDSEADEIMSFELGAVDYVKKPLSIGAFLARIRSILRNIEAQNRRNDQAASNIRIQDLEIRLQNYSVLAGEQEIFFSKKEFELLVFLARHPGMVLTRQTILQSLWGNSPHIGGRTVDVHIRKIREKLGEHGKLISTAKRVGYRFLNHTQSLLSG